MTKPKVNQSYDFCETTCPPLPPPPIKSACSPCRPTHCSPGRQEADGNWDASCNTGQCQKTNYLRPIRPCPPGMQPQYPPEFYLAKNPVFESVFGCYTDEEILQLLQTFACYKLCTGCRENDTRSIVLATAHFLTLELLQRNMNATTFVQASKGSEIKPYAMPSTFISSANAQNPDTWYQWLLTTYGLQYNELKIQYTRQFQYAVGSSF